VHIAVRISFPDVAQVRFRFRPRLYSMPVMIIVVDFLSKMSMPVMIIVVDFHVLNDCYFDY
jgi:hypothetical protein